MSETGDRSAVFLDTSIMIARFIHGPRVKERIRERLAEFRTTVTGSVVRQEFRRRLLKEAQYMSNLLDRLGSAEAVQRHVLDVLPAQQVRKMRICLETITTVYEGVSEPDRTERLRIFLRFLLAGGLGQFDLMVDRVVTSGCDAGGRSIVEKKNGDFEFGSDHCSRSSEDCKIGDFLSDRSEAVARIRSHLGSAERATHSKEILGTIDFMKATEADHPGVGALDPCLNVGDYLIALESADASTMYTMNAKESQHFCRALGQTMIVRKPNPEHDDIICAHDDPDWPIF